jgi:peptidoglycan DL-endopeptidase CwlO
MERWKKGLMIGLFSSMFLEQGVVEAAIGLEHPANAMPHGTEQQAGSAVAVAEPSSRTLVKAASPEPPEMRATEEERVMLALQSRERIKRFARFLPPANAKEEPAASREKLAELKIHDPTAEAARQDAPVAAQEAPNGQPAIASRGGLSPVAGAAAVAKEKNAASPSAATKPTGQTKQAAGASNTAPTLNAGSGATATQSSKIATLATKYTGVPYKYGGTTPQAFDCSGFIQYVYQEAGYEIPRTTYQQYAAGTPISRGSLQSGDIVFFACGGSPTSHAGIYLGNGKFIHADQTHGITVSDLDSGYWSGVYQAGVRIR